MNDTPLQIPRMEGTKQGHLVYYYEIQADTPFEDGPFDIAALGFSVEVGVTKPKDPLDREVLFTDNTPIPGLPDDTFCWELLHLDIDPARHGVVMLYRSDKMDFLPERGMAAAAALRTFWARLSDGKKVRISKKSFEGFLAEQDHNLTGAKTENLIPIGYTVSCNYAVV